MFDVDDERCKSLNQLLEVFCDVGWLFLSFILVSSSDKGIFFRKNLRLDNHPPPSVMGLFPSNFSGLSIICPSFTLESLPYFVLNLTYVNLFTNSNGMYPFNIIV